MGRTLQARSCPEKGGPAKPGKEMGAVRPAGAQFFERKIVLLFRLNSVGPS
jgi:hypothetical protein